MTNLAEWEQRPKPMQETIDIWDEDPYQMNVIEPVREDYEWFQLETQYANAD